MSARVPGLIAVLTGLLVLIPSLLPAPAAAQAPPEVQRLHDQLLVAFEKEDWARAIVLGRRIHEMRPVGGAAAYNLASAYARSGDAPAAAQWLVKAGEDGFQGNNLVRSDPNLATVRDQPAYARALELIDRNRKATFDAFCREHDAKKPEVILPRRYDRKTPAPVILALHSYGGTPEEQAAAWREAADRAGAILVVPCAQRRIGDAGYQWLYIDESEWLVLRAIEQVKKDHTVDASRIVVTGFSQGGNIAFLLATRHPHLFKGCIPMGFHYEANVATPSPDAPDQPAFAFLIGDRDQAAGTNPAAKEAVERAGGRAMLRMYRGMGHNMPPNRTRELTEALEFVLSEG